MINISVYTFKPDPYSSHAKILRIIKSRKGKLRILDVGCSKGYIGKELVPFGHEMHGIEYDKKDAQAAKRYYKTIKVGDLDSLKLNYKKNFFDIIILGDVLEHLKNPLEVLAKLREFLKKDGIAIISTGNVANWYIRLNLLFGQFNYTDRGILDKTHLKLFTLKTFKKLVKEAKMRVVKVETTPIPLPLVIESTGPGKPLSFLHHINAGITKLSKTFFGYQIILVARK